MEKTIPSKSALYAYALAFYTVIASIVTYPLIVRFTTHSAGGQGDDNVMLWNLWWAKYAILDIKTNPLYTDHIFFPFETGLAYHAYILLNSLASIPLQFSLDIVTIYNIFTILSFTLAGFGAFLLINHLIDDWKIALLAGVLFAFCPYRFLHLTGNLSMSQWLPFYTLFFIKIFETSKVSIKNGLLAGLFLGFIFLSDFYYFIMVLIFSIPMTIYFVRINKFKISLLCKNFLLIIISSIPLIAPILIVAIFSNIDGMNTLDIPYERSGVYNYSSDLFAFFSPSPNSLLLGNLSFNNLFTTQSSSFLGFTAILLSVIGYLKYRGNVPHLTLWIIASLIFLILALGPKLIVLGYQTNIPLPFLMTKYIPILSNVRVPYRFVIVISLCLSILGAYGLKYCSGKIIILPYILIVLFVMESITPFSTTVRKTPQAILDIRADTSADMVLNIPFFLRDGFGGPGIHDNTISMYYQTIHNKKMFGGYLARIPHTIKLSFMNLPIFRSLLLIEENKEVHNDYVVSDIKAANDILNLFDIDYVLVNKDNNTVNNILIQRSVSYLKGLIPLR
ncbi:hypothetical protein ACFLZI_01080 [Nitrospirota bacterium]